MIDFDEELEKFYPSEEVEEISKVVNQQDLTDMTDIMRQLMQDTKETR